MRSPWPAPPPAFRCIETSSWQDRVNLHRTPASHHANGIHVPNPPLHQRCRGQNCGPQSDSVVGSHETRVQVGNFAVRRSRDAARRSATMSSRSNSPKSRRDSPAMIVLASRQRCHEHHAFVSKRTYPGEPGVCYASPKLVFSPVTADRNGICSSLSSLDVQVTDCRAIRRNPPVQKLR